MRIAAVFLGAALLGCSFQPQGTRFDDPDAGDDVGGGDGGPTADGFRPVDARPTPDAMPGSPDARPWPSIAHVAAGDEVGLASTVDWNITTDTRIDTSDGSIRYGTTIPAGVVIKPVAQEGGGPDLLIVYAANIRVSANVELLARGPRALVLAAAGEIAVDGEVDGSAGRLQDGSMEPGPAGAGPGQGPGAGAGGASSQGYDSGGGGGGFGQAGAEGGASQRGPRTAAGTSYGDAQLTVLEGGSGGGNASPCRQGGAGGGAAQRRTSRSRPP